MAGREYRGVYTDFFQHEEGVIGLHKADDLLVAAQLGKPRQQDALEVEGTRARRQREHVAAPAVAHRDAEQA